MAICGPKYALCGILISIWGIIQLVLMGVFFYVKSVALVDDVKGHIPMKDIRTSKNFYEVADRVYTNNAINCWIAALLYVFTLLFSAYQFRLNTRASHDV